MMSWSAPFQPPLAEELEQNLNKTLVLSVLNITRPTIFLRLLPTSTPRPNPALVIPFNTQELKTSFRMHSPDDCLILSTPSRVRHNILCLLMALLPTTVHIGRILAILPLSNYFPRWISLLVLMISSTSFTSQHVDLNNSYVLRATPICVRQ